MKRPARKSPDARLIARGVELETAIKAWRKAYKPFAAKAYKPFAAAEAAWFKGKNTAKAARLEAKKEAADKINTRALDAVSKTARHILRMKARTLEGVMVKFFAAAWEQWGEENPSAFDNPDNKPADAHGPETAGVFSIGCDVAAIIKRSAG